jgi:hypothetical protein
MDDNNCLALLSHAVENANLRTRSGPLKQHVLDYIVSRYEALAVAGENVGVSGAEGGLRRLQQLPPNLFQEVQVAFNVHLLRLTMASLAAKKI